MALSHALTYDYLRGTLDKLVFSRIFANLCAFLYVCKCVFIKKDLHNRLTSSSLSVLHVFQLI